jgi:hypothetical protein
MPYFDSKTEMVSVNDGMFRYKPSIRSWCKSVPSCLPIKVSHLGLLHQLK